MDIKQLAIRAARRRGLINLSRSGLCKLAGIPNGSFVHYAGCSFTELVEQLKDTGLPMGDKVTKTRTDPALRREFIVQVAGLYASIHGLNKLTRNAVAEAAGVSGGLVSLYFPGAALKDAVVGYAVRNEILSVIAEALLYNSAIAKAAPVELKVRAIEQFSKK